MKLFSTKEFSERAGVSIRSLKRWLKKGILQPVTTRDNGYNFYSQEQLEKFKGVTQTRDTENQTYDTESKTYDTESKTYDKPMTQNEFVTPLIHNVTPSTYDTVTPLSQVENVTDETEDTKMTEFNRNLKICPSK